MRQVNEMPSFETGSGLDRDVKSAVLAEALRIVSPTARRRQRERGRE